MKVYLEDSVWSYLRIIGISLFSFLLAFCRWFVFKDHLSLVKFIGNHLILSHTFVSSIYVMILMLGCVLLQYVVPPFVKRFQSFDCLFAQFHPSKAGPCHLCHSWVPKAAFLV